MVPTLQCMGIHTGPFYEKEKDLITLNPGSLCYPRQQGRKPSYMLMQIDDNGKMEITQEYLNP